MLVAAILAALTLPPYRGLPVPWGMRIRRPDSRRQDYQVSLSLRRIGRSLKNRKVHPSISRVDESIPFWLLWTPVAPCVQLSRGWHMAALTFSVFAAGQRRTAREQDTGRRDGDGLA